jgi:hypothetical protein
MTKSSIKETPKLISWDVSMEVRMERQIEISQKEWKVIHQALVIAAYQLEKQPAKQRPEYDCIKGLISKFSPRNTAIYFCETSVLFDPPKSAEDALARYEQYGAKATIADMWRLFPE